MNRNKIAKIFVGVGLALLGVLYFITSSGDFESRMLALSPENSDLASMVMFGVLGGAVVSLVTAKFLYKAPEA